MALTTFIGCFYLTLSMISAASLSMSFHTFSIARGQMEMPLPLPSLSSNTSQAPLFPPQMPSPQITHPQVPSPDQDHFPQVQPPLINSTTLTNNKIDLSNFLRDYSANFSSCNQLAVSNIIASGSQSSSPARNAIDNNINTRWSNLGLGSLITFDFGAERFLCNIDIAWYRGNERVINFTISASNDSQSWKPLVMNSSSGTSSESESYDLPDIAARYLQITVTGSSLSDWVSISEAKVFGSLVPNSSATVSKYWTFITNQNSFMHPVSDNYRQSFWEAKLISPHRMSLIITSQQDGQIMIPNPLLLWIWVRKLNCVASMFLGIKEMSAQLILLFRALTTVTHSLMF